MISSRLLSGKCIHRLINRSYATPSKFIISAEVLKAKSNNVPIVALESTIITHGMPYPQNLETAIEVENIVRGRKACPATIAIIDGVVNIGLSEEKLVALAQLKNVRKCSVRDLPFILASSGNGATTVASTMRLSNMVGIKVFATGGIGGVHRGVEETMDISADLTELGKTPVTVVCAGVKSILDIPRTLEYLETMGVPVVGYNTDEFPAFYTPSSGVKAPWRMNDAGAIARAIAASAALNMTSGMVVGVPNPDPASAKDIEAAIHQALSEMKGHGIKGAEATPFLLKRVAELTKGDSLRSNISLIKHNASVASDIAVELSKLQSSHVENVASSLSSFSLSAKPAALGKDIITKTGEVIHIPPGVMSADGPLPSVSTERSTQLHNVSHLEQKGNSHSKYDHQIHQCHDEVMATGEIIHMSSGNTTSGVAKSHPMSVAENKIHISTKTGEIITITPSTVTYDSVDVLLPSGESVTLDFGSTVSGNINVGSSRGEPITFSSSTETSFTRDKGVHTTTADTLHFSESISHVDGSSRTPSSSSVPVVIGGAAMDILAYPKQGTQLNLGDKTPGEVREYYGGVGRNIAEAMARLRSPPLLITSIGSDSFSDLITAQAGSLGIPTEGIIRNSKFSTPCYLAVHDHKGEVAAAITDMESMELLQPQDVAKFTDHISRSPLLILDSNLRIDTMKRAAQIAVKANVPILLEPVSIAKCIRCIDAGILGEIKYITPSVNELVALYTRLKDAKDITITPQDIVAAVQSGDLAILRHPFKRLLMNMKKGSIILSKFGGHGVCTGVMEGGKIAVEHFEGQVVEKVVSTTGAGDNFAAGFSVGIVNNLSLSEAIELGQAASRESIKGEAPVSETLALVRYRKVV